MIIHAKTIDEVLDQLDAIIGEAKKNNDPLGFFAYIYRRTTAQIKLAITDKQFEDNERMEKFDVHFANKYLDAHRDYISGRPVCSPWAAAFDIKNDKLTILQHIILGMNAHINYDLGMSAAEFSSVGELESMKNDFMKVNDVLASLVDELQVKVGRVSRLMFLLDWFTKQNDEVVLNFSMEKARKQAWNFAVGMSVLEGQAKQAMIEEVDGIIGRLGDTIKHPRGKVFAYTLKVISFFEVKDVRKILSKLEAD